MGTRLGDPGVDATSIGVEDCPSLRIEMLDRDVCCVPHLQTSLLLVVLDIFLAQYLCEVSGRNAANHVHLPQAILSGHVALNKDGIDVGCGVDMGNPVLVAVDGDR